MTNLATRMGELRGQEGFDVEMIDNMGNVVDPEESGFPEYKFGRRAKGSMTVSEWKEKRFHPTYRGYSCRVLNSDGTEANGNKKLQTVRETYKEE